MLDMNAPKMTAQDLPLFRHLIGDLFPGISIPHVDYSEVRHSSHGINIYRTIYVLT